jgi:transcriptional regulator with XRE-family HTH domain
MEAVMAKADRNGGNRAERRGGSRKLDLDSLLKDRPLAQQSAEWAQAAAIAGELVRRKREEKGFSQTKLASMIGSTQAHLSEIERGLGAHGPTVDMLTRIMRKLDDELVLDTKTERQRRESELIVTARSSVRDITMQMSEDLQRLGLNVVAQFWSDAGKQTEGNPFARMLAEGMLAGFYMALQWVPGHSRKDILSALRSIEGPATTKKEELPAQLVRRTGRA